MDLNIPEAVWWTEMPTIEQLESLRIPSFLASSLRGSTSNPLLLLWRLVPRFLLRPRVSVRAYRSGKSVRELLRLALWLDTARFFGVSSLREPDMSVSVLSAFLSPDRRNTGDPGSPRVGAVIISQNRSRRLQTTLIQVKQLASQIVVVDGGSVDDTRDVACEAGADVVLRQFDQDFSVQRNAGMERIGKELDWVLRVDDDEALAPGLIDYLRDVMGRARRFDAIVAPVHTFAPSRWATPGTVVVAIRPSLRYRGNVHERPNWRRPLFLPISSPALENHKTYREYLESALLYSALQPADFPPGFHSYAAGELAALDDGEPSAEPPDRAS
jgi:hypothetical protein